MELPVLDGVIDRRILVNYRVDPEVVKAILPPHLEPLIINGYASAGICLLRLKNVGIKYSPSFLRITSENAAHRFLVRYREADKEACGVYIPRRDTDSVLNVLLAGKVYAWPHYPALFRVTEANGHYAVTMKSKDFHTSLHVQAERSNLFPRDSMFDSIDHASKCFHDCHVGVSPSAIPNRFKTIRLITKTWDVKPLHVYALQSTFFEDKAVFPEGSIAFDNALLMEGIEHEWHSGPNEM
jgi:hypothetical protein